MNNKEYKKTYKGLVIWMISIIAIVIPIVVVGCSYKGNNPLGYMYLSKISFLLFLLWIDALMYVIYKGQYIYWINGGPDYETAKAAGEKKRKLYCKIICEPFLKWSIVYVIYFTVSMILQFSLAIDIGAFTIVIIICGLSSINVKLS